MYSDTTIKRSYEVLDSLKQSLKLVSYPGPPIKNVGSITTIIALVYTTLDGKQHTVSQVEIS